MVCLFVVMIYLLEAEFLVIVRIILEVYSLQSNQSHYWPMLRVAWKTILTDYLSGTARSSIAHDSNTLGTFANESVSIKI